jgi:hypothetical protein
MDDLELWSDADMQKACRYGFVIAGGMIGAAFGGFASTATAGAAAPLTVPAGAAYGAALGLGTGLLACRFVTRDKVERLLGGQPTTLGDAKEVANALGKLTGVRDKEQIWYLLAQARGARVSGGGACTSAQLPVAAARELLAWQAVQRGLVA